MMRHFLAAALVLFASNSSFAADDPAQPVRQIYQAYIAAEKSRKPGSEPDMYNPRYYSARINALVAKLKKACEKRDDICMPDADFLVDGQDFQIRDLKVSTDTKEIAKARVSASFKNFDAPRRITFQMVLEGNRWVIDEFKATSKEQPDGYTLTESLKPNPPSR